MADYKSMELKLRFETEFTESGNKYHKIILTDSNGFELATLIDESHHLNWILEEIFECIDCGMVKYDEK